MCSVASVVEIDGMRPVEVLALWGTVGISGVDCPCIVGAIEHEVVGVFTETVQVRLFRKMSLEVYILAFEDQLLASGIEQNFSSVRTRNREREWVRLKIELKLRVFGRAPLTKSWAREDLIRNLGDN